jgi:hypothetical protein
VDYALTDALYLRGSLLYGIRLASKFEKDLDDLMKAAAGGIDCHDPKQGHGLTVKAAIGYKF